MSRLNRRSLTPLRLILGALISLAVVSPSSALAQPRFTVTFPAARSSAPLDGRLLVYISADTTGNPRLQVNDNAATAQVFGVDVDGWRPGAAQSVDASAFGYPLALDSASGITATPCTSRGTRPPCRTTPSSSGSTPAAGRAARCSPLKRGLPPTGR